MAWDRDWLARSDWQHRPPELGALAAYGYGDVAMDFAMPGASAAVVSDQLWQLWCALPAHPNILRAVDKHRLRYAALDWTHRPIALDLDPAGVDRVGTWGNVLARTYEFVLRHVPPTEVAWLACPFICFDLEGAVRVAFVSVGKSEAWRARLPPEIFDRWPLCDQPGLVYVIGQALRGLVVPARTLTPLDHVIARCVDRDRSRRFATLAELSGALRGAGGRPVPRAEFAFPRGVWDLVEVGIGLLAIDEPLAALARFEAALLIDSRSRAALDGRDEALRRGAAARVPVRPPAPVRIPWLDARPLALSREHERDFAGALAVYQQVDGHAVDIPALEMGMARCHFELGDFGATIDRATRALRVSDRAAARALLVNGLLRARRYADALDNADAWIARDRGDARAHHARGKCLIGLGRLIEARTCFQRACELDPQLLEAMLLRRELDRSMAELRATVGTGAAAVDVRAELPAHLVELRDVLAGGRIAEAIERLRRTEHHRDMIAQLLLAALLSFAGRPEEALEVCARVIRCDASHLHDALLVKANALLEVARPADALVVFDQVRAERPDLLDALEGRARALARLGRHPEAATALDEYVASAIKQP